MKTPKIQRRGDRRRTRHTSYVVPLPHSSYIVKTPAANVAPAKMLPTRNLTEGRTAYDDVALIKRLVFMCRHTDRQADQNSEQYVKENRR